MTTLSPVLGCGGFVSAGERDIIGFYQKGGAYRLFVRRDLAVRELTLTREEAERLFCVINDVLEAPLPTQEEYR